MGVQHSFSQERVYEWPDCADRDNPGILEELG